MSRWFRHYAGMARDDKLVRVAIRSQQTIERVVWVWAAILESAAEIDDGGRYDFDIPEAAYFLRADEADVARIVTELEALDRVRDNSVVRWGDRQFQSDRSAERQKRYRDRRRRASADCDGDGGVTSPSRHRDAPETETETEDTDAIASDADKPASPPVALTPSQQVWDRYPHQLAAMAGKSEASVRRWMGKALKEASPEAFAGAADAALAAGTKSPPAVPQDWVS